MSIRFAVIGINHNHIYGQVECLLRGGAEFVSFHAPEDDLAAAFGAKFPQAQRVRTLLREVPIANIVLETDAPDIPPSFLGTMGSRARNSPAYLPQIGVMLAEVRGTPVDAFAAATTANVRRVLGLG